MRHLVPISVKDRLKSHESFQRLAYALRPLAVDPLYEPEMADALRHHLKLGDVFVDVGAHMGLMSAVAAEAGAKVVAFEAHPKNARVLRRRVRKSGYAIEVVNAAVREVKGTVELFRGRKGGTGEFNIVGHDVEGQQTQRITSVRCVTLDGFFGDSRVDVVKIDVEGAEDSVLRGASGIIADQRPVFLIEFHNDDTWHDRKLLLDAGYIITDTQGNVAGESRLYHALAQPL